MTNRTATVRLLALAACLACASRHATSAAADTGSPLSPAESLGQFQLQPGLAIELVACEPQVIDPIAIRFDEDGRLWVVEMRDYPHGPPEGEKPLSKIRVLTDTNRDGRYETSRTFADHLLFPTGVQPWRGGLFVTLAGAVVYLKDTDGDGRADVQQTWYRGFAEKNPQLRANHPRLALDGRMYIANGLRGGAVVDARSENADPPAKPISISGRDFAFDPRTGAFEAISGNGQFGLTFDDFGNRFTCNNRAPVQHVVLANRYTARNPFLAVSSVIQDVAPMGERSRVYPLTAAWTTSNLHAGQFTAACGVTIYRGDALGDEYRGNAIICEPTGSLVHREVLKADGVSFASHAPHEGKEFLASPDPWFRPVNLEIGPDGALYVVDMYRAVIEHPQFMPSELQKRPDLRDGDDRGRIYRIVRQDAKPRLSAPKLSSASSAELAELLQHKNAWWRETAARLLLEREDTAIAPALEALATGAPEPATRAGALWLLSNLNALASETLTRALADEDPRVREQAVALAESRLADDPALRQKVIAAAALAAPRVQFRAALALGGLASADAVQPLVAIALAQPLDRWTRTAVATALPSHTGAMLQGVLRSPALDSQPHDSPQLALVRELATIVGASRDQADVATILAIVGDERDTSRVEAREAALSGLAQGLARRGAALVPFVSKLPEGKELGEKLATVFSRIAAEAAREALPVARRSQKIDLLKYDRSQQASDVLVSIVSDDPSHTLRAGAAVALAGHTATNIGPALIASYRSQTPAVRRAILDALVAQADRAAQLLDELEAERIARVEIDATRAARLTKHADPAVRKRSAKLLARPLPAERSVVLAEYRAALALEADPLAGKELFRKHCATCHHIAGIGVDVAPDISDSRVKTAEQLLTDVLNPNQAIDNNYASYTVVMLDGTVHTGIIAAETASSIRLRQPENKSLDLLRSDIEAIRSNGVSLMPEGLEKEITQQQLADLISFVKNWRYLEQSIPGTVSGAN